MATVEWRPVPYGTNLNLPDLDGTTFIVCRTDEHDPPDDRVYTGERLAHWWGDMSPGETPEGGTFCKPGLDTGDIGHSVPPVDPAQRREPALWLWNVDDNRPAITGDLWPDPSVAIAAL